MKNLDTGETTNLKEAETDLPKCVDPLVLHIMERTQDYPRYLYTKIYVKSIREDFSMKLLIMQASR